MLGRMLRCRGEEPETEYVYEIYILVGVFVAAAPYLFDLSAVDLLDGAFGNLLRRLEYVARHAERAGEVVGRTCGYDAQRERQTLSFHGIDHIVEGAVPARHHGQIDRLVAVKGVLAEGYEARPHVIPRIAEYGHDVIDIASDLAASGLCVVYQYGTLHNNKHSLPAAVNRCGRLLSAVIWRGILLCV